MAEQFRFSYTSDTDDYNNSVDTAVTFNDKDTINDIEKVQTQIEYFLTLAFGYPIEVDVRSAEKAEKEREWEAKRKNQPYFGEGLER